MRVGIYVHVPFCIRKCHYCDFYSLPIAGVADRVEAFVGAVCREMAMAAERHAGLGPFQAPSLFLGGGTPSLLRPEQMGQILETAGALFGLTPDAEITVESNPGTISAEKASAYRALGVNRVSMGVQTFDDDLLRALGREHSAAQSVDAMRVLREAGFTNISVDLISALPGQTLGGWVETLRRAIALGPEHVSAYGLMVEHGTAFAEWERQGRLALPDEDLELAMLEAGIAELVGAGFEHYEISNFALPGRRSVHNRIYWRNEPYLGFGPSAAGYIGGVRATNVRSLSGYLDAIAHGRPAVDSAEEPSPAQQMGETMMVGLRLLEGVETARFRERFGVSPHEVYADPIRRLVAAGLLNADDERLALTHQGLLLANNVVAEFLT